MQFEIKNVADKSTSYNTERKSNGEKKIANKFYKFKNDFAQNTSLDVYFFDFVDFIVAAWVRHTRLLLDKARHIWLCWFLERSMGRFDDSASMIEI